jgi:hypothetical protein
VPFKKINFSLGFELWEILTAFTLALTLASFLLWSSGLQPRHIQEQFIWQEQAKNTLYNTALKMDKLNSSSINALSKTSTTYCQLDNYNLQTDKIIYNEQKESIQIEQKNLDLIKQRSKENTAHTGSKVLFEELVKSYDQYLQKSKDILEKKLFVSEQVIVIKNSSPVICNPDQKLRDLPTLAFQELALEKNSSDDKNLEILAQNSSEILNFAMGLEEKSIAELPVEKQEFLKTKYQNIWSVRDILKVNFELPSSDRADILIALKKFEDWQLSFVQKEKELDKKVVFVAKE